MLAGFARNDPYSTEGAIKYFLLGSFSSAILLFGLAYVWGTTGSTRISDVAAALAVVASSHSIQPGLAMGLAFMTTGVAFKMAAVAVPLLDTGRLPGLADAGHGRISRSDRRSGRSPSCCGSSSARWGRSRPTGCRW